MIKINQIKLKIFFDESNYGKNKNNKSKGKHYSKLKIDLMGGIAIPDQIYAAQGFDEFNQLVKKNKFKLHWVEYKGYSGDRERITKIMTYVAKFYKLLDINIIYKEHRNYTNIKNNQIKDMMYYKFPERIIYGLLREYNQHTKVVTDIYIEEASEYEKKEINLKKNTIKNLQKQAIYRGQSFDISSDRFFYVDCRENFDNIKNKEKEKILNNREIGVYIIDLILGIVRTILENNYYTKTHKELSANVRDKNELVMILVTNDDFYNMIKDINLFFWKYDETLGKINMEEYIKSFLSNQKLWINYIDSDRQTKLYI